MPKATKRLTTGFREISPPDPNSEVVLTLRKLASSAARAGADPQEIAHPDHELLGLCDQIVMLRRREEEAWDLYRTAVFRSSVENTASAIIKTVRQDLRKPMLRAGKLRATTAAGIYAKAVAVRRSGDSAAVLGKSLAEDLLACPELRLVLWPSMAVAAAPA